MKKTPIVFSFNEAYVMPAGVCITSLLINANTDTFYDIFILYSSERLSLKGINEIKKLKEIYSNCEFTFLDVKDAFQEAYEIRGITVDAYYRLLIPELIKNYDKVIYSDVDVVFDEDISTLLLSTFNDNLILGRHDRVPSKAYLDSIELGQQNYINSGVLILDLNKIRKEENIIDVNSDLLKKKYLYQDQDVINIFYKGRIGFIKEKYNFTFLQNKEHLSSHSEKPSIFHYTGAKPWNNLVAFGDIWWGYYKTSIFYKQEYYLEFTKNQYVDFNESQIILKIIHKLKVRGLMLKVLKYI